MWKHGAAAIIVERTHRAAGVRGVREEKENKLQDYTRWLTCNMFSAFKHTACAFITETSVLRFCPGDADISSTLKTHLCLSTGHDLDTEDRQDIHLHQWSKWRHSIIVAASERRWAQSLLQVLNDACSVMCLERGQSLLYSLQLGWTDLTVATLGINIYYFILADKIIPFCLKISNFFQCCSSVMKESLTISLSVDWRQWIPYFFVGLCFPALYTWFNLLSGLIDALTDELKNPWKPPEFLWLLFIMGTANRLKSCCELIITEWVDHLWTLEAGIVFRGTHRGKWLNEWWLNSDTHWLNCFLNRLLRVTHGHTRSSSCSALQAHGEANRFNLAAVPLMSE